MRAPRHERTVPVVRSGPRQTERIPLPKPQGLLRRAVWSPVVVLACAAYLLGAGISLMGFAIAACGMGLITVSDSFLHWIYGGARS